MFSAAVRRSRTNQAPLGSSDRESRSSQPSQDLQCHSPVLWPLMEVLPRSKAGIPASQRSNARARTVMRFAARQAQRDLKDWDRVVDSMIASRWAPACGAVYEGIEMPAGRRRARPGLTIWMRDGGFGPARWGFGRPARCSIPPHASVALAAGPRPSTRRGCGGAGVDAGRTSDPNEPPCFSGP